MREISFSAFSSLLESINFALYFDTGLAKDAQRFFVCLQRLIEQLSALEREVSQDLMLGAESLARLMGNHQFNPEQPDPGLLPLMEKTCRHWESYFESVGCNLPNAGRTIGTEDSLDLALEDALQAMLSWAGPMINHPAVEAPWIKLSVELLEYLKEIRTTKAYTNTYYRLQWLVKDILSAFSAEGFRLMLLDYDQIDPSFQDFKLVCEIAWQGLSV